jgi:general stress protein 26
MNVDDPEVQRFIRHAMVARIATLSRRGRPSITPLYFNYTDGHIWLGTSSWTLAAREASADPRVTILLQNERDQGDRRILRISGVASVRTDELIIRRRNRQTAFKYVLTPRGLVNWILSLRLIAVVRQYHAQNDEKGPGCVIDVTPQRIEFLDAMPSH